MIPGTRTSIVCDTTCYLPAQLLGQHDIGLVSLYVTIEGFQQREGEIAAGDYGGFFERLLASSDGATTSQPSVGDFIAVYEPLLEAGREIVSLHISSGISGTSNAAVKARSELIASGKGGERIRIVDSRSAAGGLGLITVSAALRAEAGAGADEVVAAAERTRDALSMWFMVDTLEYLRKGGRIGAAQAWVGSALQVKPILTLGAEITPVERVRTRSRAFARMVDYARSLEAKGVDQWVVQHIRDKRNAERLVDECRQIFGSDPAFVSEIGPVLGAYTGPGVLGVGGVPAAALG